MKVPRREFLRAGLLAAGGLTAGAVGADRLLSAGGKTSGPRAAATLNARRPLPLPAAVGEDEVEVVGAATRCH